RNIRHAIKPKPLVNCINFIAKNKRGRMGHLLRLKPKGCFRSWTQLLASKETIALPRLKSGQQWKLFWAPRYFKMKTTGWIRFQPLAQSFATLKAKLFKASDSVLTCRK